MNKAMGFLLIGFAVFAVVLIVSAFRHRRRIASEAGRVAVNGAADLIKAKRAVQAGAASFRQKAVEKATTPSA